MIYNLPLRFTTLHFAQRLRMEGATFISAFLLTDDTNVSGAIKFLIILVCVHSVQMQFPSFPKFTRSSGREQEVNNQRARGQSGEEALLR